MSGRSAVAIVLVAVTSGCGTSTAALSVNGGSATAAGSGVAMTIDSIAARSVWTSGDVYTSPAGEYFFVPTVTLRDTSSATLPVSAGLFSTTTDQGVAYTAAVPLDSTNCAGGESLVSGGQLQCELQFTIGDGQTPLSVGYDDDQGHTVSVNVPLPPSPSAECESVAAPLWGSSADSLSGACVTCMDQSCFSKFTAYGAGCIDEYDCPAQDHDDFCLCRDEADSPECQADLDDFLSCMASSCSTACP